MCLALFWKRPHVLQFLYVTTQCVRLYLITLSLEKKKLLVWNYVW